MGCGPLTIQKLVIAPAFEDEEQEHPLSPQDFGTKVQVAVLSRGEVIDWVSAIALSEKESSLRVKIADSKTARKYDQVGKEVDIPWKHVKKPDPPKPKIENPFTLTSEEIS